MYEIELADGRVIECCKDHQWFVYDENGDEKATTITQLLSEGFCGSPAHELCVSYIQHNIDANADKRYWIPNIEAIQYPEEEYEISPHAMGRKVHDECQTDPGTHIPIEYLYGSVTQRSELLRGILGLGNEDKIPDWKVEIHLGTSGLSYKVIGLIRSLGGTASVRYAEKKT